LIPLYGRLVILFDSEAHMVVDGYIILRLDIALFSAF
jgi:hypothetical protein